MLLSLIR